MHYAISFLQLLLALCNDLMQIHDFLVHDSARKAEALAECRAVKLYKSEICDFLAHDSARKAEALAECRAVEIYESRLRDFFAHDSARKAEALAECSMLARFLLFVCYIG